MSWRNSSRRLKKVLFLSRASNEACFLSGTFIISLKVSITLSRAKTLPTYRFRGRNCRFRLAIACLKIGSLTADPVGSDGVDQSILVHALIPSSFGPGRIPYAVCHSTSPGSSSILVLTFCANAGQPGKR